MDLLVVRHGIAEPAGWGKVDADRALTEPGRRALIAGAQGLARLGIRVHRVLSSPLVRARETAEILAGPLGGASVEAVARLASGASAADFVTTLRAQADDASVAVVGHAPDVGFLAASLIGAPEGRGVLDFAPGAVACFDAEFFPRGHQATLRWFLAPEILVFLGEGHRPQRPIHDVRS